MNTDQMPFETSCFSIRNPEENQDIIFQKSIEIHKHEVQRGWLVLSKNDFGKVKKRINLGIFNKKTNFIIGEKNSLMVWDNVEKKVLTVDTSVLADKKNNNRYFLIYDMNFIANFKNDTLIIEDKINNNKIEVKLNRQFGNDIGTFLSKFKSGDAIPEDFNILKSIIFIKEGKLSLNKQVLINSNFEFLLGILEAYIQQDTKFILNGNINIYNITYILNLLGAQYSIRTVEGNKKHIRFKLPLFLKQFTTLDEIYFRSYKYFFEDGVLVPKKNIISLIPNASDISLAGLVNSGLIEMIPSKDLVFLPLEEPATMYDLTMPDANATNYSLPGTPFMKNSDGDVLGVIAIHTKDAAEECVRKFSTELKENFLNLNTGRINNWGAKLDGILGLYSATK